MTKRPRPPRRSVVDAAPADRVVVGILGTKLLIAEAAHRLDHVTRPALGILQLRTQAKHVHVDRSRLDVRGRAPDIGQQLRAPLRATAAFGEKGEELIAENAWTAVRDAIKEDPNLLSQSTHIWVPASSELDAAADGGGEPEFRTIVQQLRERGALQSGFNASFLSRADSTDPTAVGIWGALKGSILTMLVTLLIAFPIGVLSAVYLEEYAPKNRWTDLIEVSINNLAAVPSIIFGLLGLAVFLGMLGLPRSAPLVGGLTLALMIMPVIVIAGRNAIKAVPPSDRKSVV